jgi:hypothetical protein
MSRIAIHNIIAYFRTFDSSSFNSVASFPFHGALLQIDKSIADVLDSMLLEDVMLHEHRARASARVAPFDYVDAAHPTLSRYMTIYHPLYYCPHILNQY